jgi:hypothetical protein
MHLFLLLVRTQWRQTPQEGALQNMLLVPVNALVLAVSADTVATNATGGRTAKGTVHLFAHQSSSAHKINH